MFPKRAIFRRSKDRFYNWDDFRDGEVVKYAHECADEENTKHGYAWYRSETVDDIKIVHEKELIPA